MPWQIIQGLGVEEKNVCRTKGCWNTVDSLGKLLRHTAIVTKGAESRERHVPKSSLFQAPPDVWTAHDKAEG